MDTKEAETKSATNANQVENVIEKTNDFTVYRSTKIDLEKELKKQYGEHFVTLKDSILQLVAPASLYNPFASYDITDIKQSLKGFEVKQYDQNNFEFYKNNSIFRVQYWETEELTTEYTELRDTIFTGQIQDSTVVFSSGIRLRMPKTEFFLIFFNNYIGFTDSIKLVAAWEDERGESATVYFFKEELLTKIEFGKHNY